MDANEALRAVEQKLVWLRTPATRREAYEKYAAATLPGNGGGIGDALINQGFEAGFAAATTAFAGVVSGVQTKALRAKNGSPAEVWCGQCDRPAVVNLHIAEGYDHTSVGAYCEGHGLRELRLRSAVAGGIEYLLAWIDCPRCEGDGAYEGHPCSTCADREEDLK